MDFARKQLEKYGWTDGKGLGKNENGISQALKPKLKRSVTGVGHDPASEFNEHWWTMLYDKAASNVEVKETDGKTKRINAKEDFTITNNTWQMKRNSKEEGKKQYSGFFVRTAVMSGGSKTENVSDAELEEEAETKEICKMTDEELFAACEGRTAHKGARHGLKALGKLARIAQQEDQLLSHPKYNGYSHAKKSKEIKDDAIEEVTIDIMRLTKCKKNNRKKQSNNNTSSEFEQIEFAEMKSMGELERDNGITQEKELTLSQPKYNGYCRVEKTKGVIEEVTLESEGICNRKKKNKRKQGNNNISCDFENIELAKVESKGELKRKNLLPQEEELSLSQPKHSGYSHQRKAKKEDVVEEVTFESGEVSKRKKKNKRKHCISSENRSREYGQIKLVEEEPIGELEREDNVCESVIKDSKCRGSVKDYIVLKDNAQDSKKRKSVEETDSINEDVRDEKVKKKKKKFKNT